MEGSKLFHKVLPSLEDASWNAYMPSLCSCNDLLHVFASALTELSRKLLKYRDQNFWTELAKPSVQLMYIECLQYRPTRNSRFPIRSIQNGNSLRVGGNNLEYRWWGNWLNLTAIQGQSLLFTMSYLCQIWYECLDQDNWTLLLRKCVLY